MVSVCKTCKATESITYPLLSQFSWIHAPWGKPHSRRPTEQAGTHSSRCPLEAAESAGRASWGQQRQTAQEDPFPWRPPTCHFSGRSGSHSVGSGRQHLFRKRSQVRMFRISIWTGTQRRRVRNWLHSGKGHSAVCRPQPQGFTVFLIQ